MTGKKRGMTRELRLLIMPLSGVKGTVLLSCCSLGNFLFTNKIASLRAQLSQVLTRGC